MRYLVDTHVLLWFVAGDDAISPRARTLIEDPAHEVMVSAASAWEISTKFRLGKLPGARLLAENFSDAVGGLGFDELPITGHAAQVAGGFTVHHRDPFDRMLAAQSLIERVPLITNDPAFETFGITALW
ncbi:MAG: type II toxin-antitoxin system VapC family toxin [Gemmatimonadaceae bacterium]